MNLLWWRLPCLIVTALLLCPRLGTAQCAGFTAPPVPFAKEILTISTTVVGLTQSVYKPAGTVAALATITMEEGDLRYEVTGSPTDTTGHYVGFPPQTFSICGIETIAAFKAIRVTNDARLTVTYYRVKSP